LLREAKKLAEANILKLMLYVTEDNPLIGIEPSAILCFRDEYPDLVNEDFRETAKELSGHSFTIEEFIASEFEKGNIDQKKFSDQKQQVKLHGHCYQKALTTTAPTIKMLSIPANYQVEEIPSGCCGMAGSFGYEKEHYELSNKIGEMILFPAIRESGDKVLIAAAGTSCRHHIFEGTGKRALHPVEILYEALIAK
jgi:Fe-S oxidoreductase